MEVASELPTILNVNPRSVYNKIDNLKQFIQERNVQIVGISESWERVENPLNKVLSIDGYEVISNPFTRKEVGGKPALVVSTEMFAVENPNQTLIKIPWGCEIVWSILTPIGANSSSIVKKIVAASFYCKPGSRKKTVLLDHISETYHFLSSKYQMASSGYLWLIRMS